MGPPPPPSSHPNPSPHELQQVLEERSALEVFLHGDVPAGATGMGEEALGQRGT